MLTSRLRVSGFVVLAGLTLLMALANRPERASSLPQQKSDQLRWNAGIERLQRTRAALPSVNYASAERTTADGIRMGRSRRYNARDEAFGNLPNNITDITYEGESFLHTAPLPLDESDVVAVCTVSNAKGYLSEDKSGAYSEYTVTVAGEPLKGRERLTASQINIERIGAKVQMPDGGTITYCDPNYGTPELGHRYLVFLKYDPGTEAFLLVTAYDLTSGRVAALDMPGQFAVFDGTEEAAFLELLKSKIK